jgi:plastocyanin
MNRAYLAAMAGLKTWLSRLAFAALLAPAAAYAAAPIEMTLKDHKFSPSVITVKAGEPFTIHLTNKDATADEFDSTALKVEKVVAGNSDGMVHIRPLAPGKYPFMGEYHAATAQGLVIAK